MAARFERRLIKIKPSAGAAPTIHVMPVASRALAEHHRRCEALFAAAQRAELGLEALALGFRRERAEDPQHGAHVVVLRAQPLGRAFQAARLLVEREHVLFLVAEVAEHRLAQLAHAREHGRRPGRHDGLARGGEQRVAAPVVLGQRARFEQHAEIVGRPAPEALI